jgi:Ca2+/Na+ antiporter
MAGGVPKSEGEPVEMTASSAAHRIHAARKQILNAVKPCEETYGLFPCSSSLSGSIFLTGAYGFLLLKGANLISDGSELLLEVLDPGLIGGLVLPILGALPDSAMIVMSGLGGTVQQANEQVAVGIGTLAGSTIMLLSIAWGGSLWVGRCDLDARGLARDRKLSKEREFDFFRTGVTTDEATPYNAYIMMVSAFLYLSPQIPAFLGRAHDPFAALVGGILCSIGLGCYCAYQVIVPELQKRKKAAAHNKFVRANAIKCAMTVASAVGGNALLDASGGINQDTLRKIFVKFDVECNGTLDKDEFRKMMVILSLSLSIQAILSSSERICINISIYNMYLCI